jgi:D-arginine dehydrogenase
VDVIVVGGGIAGVAAAYELAARHCVTLLEQEPLLAYHTTGRSAALFVENYGSGALRPLTAASRAFLDHPPDGFAEHALLTPRGAMTVARPDQVGVAEQLFAAGRSRSPAVEWLAAAAARERCPALRPGYAAAAVWEPDAADIDVAALHQGFVQGARSRGATIETAAALLRARRSATGWEVDTTAGIRGCDMVVDAAGAWGDIVAERAGVAPVGLVPKRRTAFMVAAPRESASWPMVIDADEGFYFKPDGEQMLCSPADTTPSDPVDARPEEVDVAMAIERINAATTLGIRHVRSQWAGLRTFAPDDAMVIGVDPDVAGFCWLVGQGGTGIQTASAAARLAAASIEGAPPPDDILAAGLDPAAVAVDRLR